jgi:hypothetical protein
VYSKTISGLGDFDGGKIDETRMKDELDLFLGDYIDVEMILNAIKAFDIRWGDIKSINLLSDYCLLFVSFTNGVLTYYYSSQSGKIIHFIDVLDVFVIDENPCQSNEKELSFLTLVNDGRLNVGISINSKLEKNSTKTIPLYGHVSGVFYINSDYEIMLNLKRTCKETGFVMVEERILNDFLCRAGINLENVIKTNSNLRKIIIEKIV